MKAFSSSHVGVFIGRFQPVHYGHLRVLRDAVQQGIRRFRVFIGSADVERTMKNPFTYEERRRLFESAFREEFGQDIALSLEPLNDNLYNDLKWALEFNTRVYSPLWERQQPSYVLLGYEKDASSYYLNMFPEMERHVPADPAIATQMCSATGIRKQYFQHPEQVICADSAKIPPAVADFLKDFQKASSDAYEYIRGEYLFLEEYKKNWWRSPDQMPTFVTTDALVVQDNQVLLIQRKDYPGKGKWAMPGGFLEPDEFIEDGMLRELREETGLKVPEKVLKGSIKDVQVIDNPSRSERGRIITHCFLVHLQSGFKDLPHIKGASDAAKAQWVPIHKAMLMRKEMFEDHWDIMDMMLNRNA